MTDTGPVLMITQGARWSQITAPTVDRSAVLTSVLRAFTVGGDCSHQTYHSQDYTATTARTSHLLPPRTRIPLLLDSL